MIEQRRRRQCEAAALHFGVPALRDVSVARLEAHREALDDVTYRRARRLVNDNDNARVQRAASAMMAGDAPTLGALMTASHESLARDFQVSSEALDAMVTCARTILPGCLGARASVIVSARLTNSIFFLDGCSRLFHPKPKWLRPDRGWGMASM